MKRTLWPLFLLLPAGAFASDTGSGSSLPYETWLETLQQSLSGPVAFSVALIGIFSCGATLIFTGGEIGRFMRSFIYIIMVMTMLVGANSLMSNFFNGAAVCGTSGEAGAEAAAYDLERFLEASDPRLERSC